VQSTVTSARPAYDYIDPIDIEKLGVVAAAHGTASPATLCRCSRRLPCVGHARIDTHPGLRAST
jgi:hypothetical protein